MKEGKRTCGIRFKISMGMLVNVIQDVWTSQDLEELVKNSFNIDTLGVQYYSEGCHNAAQIRTSKI